MYLWLKYMEAFHELLGEQGTNDNEGSDIDS